MLNLDDFYRARYVLSNVVRRTDLIYAPKSIRKVRFT